MFIISMKPRSNFQTSTLMSNGERITSKNIADTNVDHRVSEVCVHEEVSMPASLLSVFQPQSVC